MSSMFACIQLYFYAFVFVLFFVSVLNALFLFEQLKHRKWIPHLSWIHVPGLLMCVHVYCMVSAFRTLTLTKMRAFLLHFCIKTLSHIQGASSIRLFCSFIYFVPVLSLSQFLFHALFSISIIKIYSCVCVYVIGSDRAKKLRQMNKKGIELSQTFKLHINADSVCRINRIQCNASTHGMSHTDTPIEPKCIHVYIYIYTY